MADGNHLKIADQVDLADDDPFAELTRIMGFDPRQSAKPAAPEKPATAQPSIQQAAVPEVPAPQAPSSATPVVAAPVEDLADEDDFSMDLERELMGQFSVEEDEELAAAADEELAAALEAPFQAEPVAAAANEPEAHDIDFDLAQDFDDAMAASAGDAELDLELTAEDVEALDEPQPAMVAEPVLAVADDKDIAAEFDAAMADLDMDFASVAETPVSDAGDGKETVQASREDSGDTELRLLEEGELQLDADELHIDEDQLRIDEDQLRIDEDQLRLDEFELELDAAHPAEVSDPKAEETDLRFDDIDFADVLDAGSSVEASEPRAEENELSFDDVDFAGEFEAVADEAAADVDSVDVEGHEDATAGLAAEEAEPVMRYEPVEARRPELSPMDIAAAEYHGREREIAVAHDFNLEDELNALLGNNKPAEPAPVEAEVSDESLPLDLATPWRDVAPLNETAPLSDWRVESFTGAKPLDEPFDDMDWDLDEKVEAVAAPEPVVEYQPEVYADEDPPEAYYAEDDQPELYAEDDRLEVNAEDLDIEDDSRMSAPIEVDDGYRHTAYAAPRPEPADEAQPFDIEAFVAETTRRLETVRAAPEPYTDRSAETGAGDSAWSSPHRDPVVRGDPMKEDPLDVITALAAKYSKPLPPASYGRANNVAPPAPPAPMPPRQLAEVEDDSGDEIDFRAAFDDGAPDVETVEVTDRAVAIADDLDIPDLAFDEELPPVSAYDDLDAEFASLLNDMNRSEPAEPRSSGYDDDFADDSRAPAHPYQAETTPAPAAARHVSTIPGYDDETDQYAFDADDLPGSHSLEAAQYGPDEFDYDPGLDDAIPGAAMAAAVSRPKPQRRGMLVAAIVGGVAIVGGLGAFALSSGDNSSDTPAIVMADDGPVKVKPENPGGTTVPNQDSKVYDTVAGQDPAGEPQQEKLVTTAEEPMDMTPPAAAGEDMAAGAPKGEDRIEQILQEAENQTDTEIAAVAPRKVRTMVVKPDGTLVPRDEPEPAQATLPSQPESAAPAQEMTLSAPAPEATGALPTMGPETEQILTPPVEEAPVAAETPAPAPVAGETPAAAPEMEAAAAPAPDLQESASTPETAPVAPLRPADQPIDVVGEVQADRVASTATGAAGSWSMQIASQPSEAAAQSSYQDLARRYGSVLEGREVNIVKAEIAGKGTFWRVRVPAKSRNDAISLCENYKSSGGNCFVSR